MSALISCRARSITIIVRRASQQTGPRAFLRKDLGNDVWNTGETTGRWKRRTHRRESGDRARIPKIGTPGTRFSFDSSPGDRFSLFVRTNAPRGSTERSPRRVTISARRCTRTNARLAIASPGTLCGAAKAEANCVGKHAHCSQGGTAGARSFTSRRPS